MNKELKAATSIQKRGKYALNIPSRIKAEVEKYVLCYGTQAAIGSTLVRIMNSSELLYSFMRNCRGGSNCKLWENTLQVHLIRLPGALISQKIFKSIGTRVLKANIHSLSEFGGNVMLTVIWARGILKFMDRVKRKGITGKVEPLKQFLAEEKLTFQISISKVV